MKDWLFMGGYEVVDSPTAEGLGVLTPSSNTRLEPAISRALAAASDPVTPHFGRFRVKTIDVNPDHLAQFSPEPMLDAADLLMDARPNGMIWAGTSGGWLGLDHDRHLCDAIGERTGVGATTTSLALVDVLRRAGVTRLGFATPYVPEVCVAIQHTYVGAGFDVQVLGLGVSDNLAIARVPSGDIEKMIGELAHTGCECVVVFCTNLDASPDVVRLEREFQVDVVDSIALSAWAGARVINASAFIRGYGRLLGPDA